MTSMLLNSRVLIWIAPYGRKITLHAILLAIGTCSIRVRRVMILLFVFTLFLLFRRFVIVILHKLFHYHHISYLLKIGFITASFFPVAVLATCSSLILIFHIFNLHLHQVSLHFKVPQTLLNPVSFVVDAV